jgi:hypothetical protein
VEEVACLSPGEQYAHLDRNRRTDIPAGSMRAIAIGNWRFHARIIGQSTVCP